MKIINYKGIKYKVCLSYYSNNDNTLLLFIPVDENNNVDLNKEELIVSVNICELPSRQVAIKSSGEFKGLDSFLIENKILKPHLVCILSNNDGLAPVYELEDDVLEYYN